MWKFILQISLLLLILNVLSFYYPHLSLEIGEVKANDNGWLTGWDYRKGYVINPASGAGTNYQIKIDALSSVKEQEPETIVPFLTVKSTLFAPLGTLIISGQSAAHFDGVYLHVWFGATDGGGSYGDCIYYTKTSDFINWAYPVKVIDLEDGIRDPTILVEGDYLYLFCQCFDGGLHRPIRLFKIAEIADFTNPDNYIYVGAPIDVGSSGQFDEFMVASACVVKVGSTYWMAYEARSSSGIFSIGRAYTTNIEDSWIKDGQMRDTEGNVIYAPSGSTNDIVPCTFVDADTFFLHYGNEDGSYNLRYVKGDIPNNSMSLSSTDIKPNDSYGSYVGFAHVGFINGLYTFLLAQPYGPPRLYQQDSGIIFLNEHCRSDFGDVRFTSSDGVTPLDYWIETKVDGDYASFWVEIADDLSTNPATIYMYYGNPDAVTTSNGEDTFLFFDDFLGTSYDSNKWEVVGSPTVTVNDGELKLERNSYSGSWSVHGLRSKTFTADEKSLIVTAKTSTFSDSCNVRIDADYYSRGQTTKANFEIASAKNIYLECDRRDKGGSISSITMLSGASVDTYYTICITREGSSYSQGWLNGAYKGQVTSNVNDGSTYIGLFIEEWGSHGTIIGTYDKIAVAKYVNPAPSHGELGSEETSSEYVMINEAFVSDERSDVGSSQIVGFHAVWNNNGSDIVGGSIYVNNTESVTNSSGWVTFNVSSSSVGKDVWEITEVNCNGITTYIQTAQPPSIIWDMIKITEGGTIKESSILGETTTVWFQAQYEYDEKIFNSTNGILYVNGSQMSWSTTNNRWEYYYTSAAPGSNPFIISGVLDNSYGLTAINDTVGPQTISTWSSPFFIISNSTITELAFDSASKTLNFTVSGPTGTTGYTNLTITKTLIEDINGLTICLDQDPITYTVTSTDYFWLIHFAYNHSTHKVTVTLDSQSAQLIDSPFREATVLTIIAFAVLATTLLVSMRRLRKRHQN